MSLDAAEQAVREGDLDAALRNLQEQVRKAAVEGGTAGVPVSAAGGAWAQWERAHTQLNVAADLDAKALAMAQMYREAISCELLRAEVFAGRKSPVIFGEPEEWLALLIESLLADGTPARRPGAGAARSRIRGRPAVDRHDRRPAVRVDRRCRHAARARLRSGDQRALLLGSVQRGLRESTSRRPSICGTWSGCRRISSSPTAARPLA